MEEVFGPDSPLLVIEGAWTAQGRCVADAQQSHIHAASQPSHEPLHIAGLGLVPCTTGFAHPTEE